MTLIWKKEVGDPTAIKSTYWNTETYGSTKPPWPPPVVDSPGNRGDKSYKFYLEAEDKRQEIEPNHQTFPGSGTYFFGFAFYLGADYDLATNDWHVIWQLHGNDTTSPRFALQTRNNQLRAGDNQILLSLVKGKWYNCVIRCDFSNGVMQTFVNGADTGNKTVGRSNPNYYLKCGSYQSQATGQGTIYQTDYAVGTTYADVDPTPKEAPPVTQPSQSSVTTLDDNDPSITYQGTWESLAGTGKYGPGDHFSKVAGSGITIPFTGSRIQLYGAKASHHGSAVVAIDGVSGVTISQNSATRYENVLFYDSGVLPNGAHTLTLNVSTPVIALDRVVITADATTTPTDPPPPTTTPSTGLVSRSGTNLMLDGKKFQGVGVNSYVYNGRSGTSSEVMSAAVRAQYFQDTLKRTDGKVVWRIFCNPGWADAAFDDILRLAEANGAKLLVCLSNALGHDGQTAKNDAWYRGGWRTDGHEAHYCNMATKYKDRPGILGWELINEPGGDYIGYLGAASAVLKSIDPNHLVGTGVMYPANDPAKYKAAHAHSTIDMCSIHEYDQADGAIHHFNAGKTIANELNKPIYVGEFGFWGSADGSCPHGNDWTQGPHRRNLTQRAEKVRLRAQTYVNNGAAFSCHWAAVANRPGGCVLNFGVTDPLLSVLEQVSIPTS